jgi:predicted RNase H-like HicB family nuclease
MRYPIAIEIDNETTVCGVMVPDLPGCFSPGDTLDEAVAAAAEAAAAWIDATLDAGGAVPAPSSIEAVRKCPEYAGWASGVVAVDPAALHTRRPGAAPCRTTSPATPSACMFWLTRFPYAGLSRITGIDRVVRR